MALCAGGKICTVVDATTELSIALCAGGKMGCVLGRFSAGTEVITGRAVGGLFCAGGAGSEDGTPAGGVLVSINMLLGRGTELVGGRMTVWNVVFAMG